MRVVSDRNTSWQLEKTWIHQIGIWCKCVGNFNLFHNFWSRRFCKKDGFLFDFFALKTACFPASEFHLSETRENRPKLIGYPLWSQTFLLAKSRAPLWICENRCFCKKMFIWERSLNKVTQFSCFCWFSWVSKSFATRPVAEPNMRSKLKHLYFGVIESVQKRHRQFLKRFGEHRFLEILNPLKSERSLIIETLTQEPAKWDNRHSLSVH